MDGPSMVSSARWAVASWGRVGGVVGQQQRVAVLVVVASRGEEGGGKMGGRGRPGRYGEERWGRRGGGGELGRSVWVVKNIDN